ncbi:MAG TPA: hypothetical protein VNU96_22415 [Burkholderiales bacterium]|jgi:hypothetical protein|nr:hypothetical protein [Burkholderiales bacterium]
MVPIEQRIYARWLDIGTRVGLAMLVVGFAVYVFGVLDPHVPPQELARLWTLPVDHYVAATGAPTGWDWLRHLGKGDYLNFLGISVFASMSIVCYARIVPTLILQHDRLQLVLAASQLLVLLAAASGLFF